MTFPPSTRRHWATPISAVALLITKAALAQTGPTLPASYTTVSIYNPGGQLTGTIEPNPGDVSSPVYLATRNTYDVTSGNLVQVDTGSLASWPVAGTLPANWSGFTIYETKTYTYDVMGRKLTEEQSSAGTAYDLTQYTYDAIGREQCAAIRMNTAVYGSLPSSACTLGTAGSYGPDRITYTVYDTTNRPLTIQRAYGTSLQETYKTFTYTPNHLPQTTKDANGNLTTLAYDGLDRLSQTNFPSKTTAGTSSTTDFEQYTYDANYNRKTLVTRDSQTISYSYDNLNRMTLKQWPSSWGVSVYFGYDLRNLRLYANFSSATGPGVANTYDGFGRVSSETMNLTGTAQQISYQYDLDGNRTQVKYPDTNYIQYSYDGLDRLTQLLENGSATAVLAAYSYDTAGRIQQVVRGGGVTTTALGYDAVSRLSSYSHTLGTMADNVSYSFSYNPADQIVTQGISNNEYEPLVQSTAQSYTPNGLNQYTAVGGVSFSWDPRGNLTSNGPTTFSYDLENHLTAASGGYTASLSYDPRGRLYQSTSGSTTTTFLYDNDRIALEYNGSGTLLRRYAFGQAGDDPVVWYEGSAVGQSNRRYLHADHQSSVTTVTDGNGATLAVNQYDPYGTIGPSNQGRFQFTGQAYVSEVGLHYYKARMYNAAIGRFMQTDPIGNKDDLNLYAYVYNDPINKTDSSGEAFFLDDLVGGLVGGLLGMSAEGWKDIYGLVFGGDTGSSGKTAGAFAAGAVAGVGAVNAPESGGLSVAAVVTSGAASALGNAVEQKVDTGTVDVQKVAEHGAAGALLGPLAAKLLPGLKDKGVTVGQNSMKAVAQAVKAKLANGTAAKMSAKTAAKAAASEADENVLRDGVAEKVEDKLTDQNGAN